MTRPKLAPKAKVVRPTAEFNLRLTGGYGKCRFDSMWELSCFSDTQGRYRCTSLNHRIYKGDKVALHFLTFCIKGLM